MKYLLMICDDGPSEETGDSDPTAWVEQHDRSGVRLFGDRLRPARDATTVRIRESQLMITDGPFIETKEQLAGIDIIECANLDEAIEVAAGHPMAKFGVVEVRPFWTE
jgi:hypothetical protein